MRLGAEGILHGIVQKKKWAFSDVGTRIRCDCLSLSRTERGGHGFRIVPFDFEDGETTVAVTAARIGRAA